MTKLSHAGAHLVLPAQTSNRTCPNCNSTYLDRVQRRVIDRIIGLAIPLKRYHCSSCGWEGNLKISGK